MGLVGGTDVVDMKQEENGRTTGKFAGFCAVMACSLFGGAFTPLRRINALIYLH